jgi:MYXO-CTERM domain-containing protein
MQARLSIRVCVALSSLVVASLSGVAEAHFNLNMPASSDANNDGGKGAPPCGPARLANAVVTPVMGGHALTISVTETVYHPGHYRFALATSRAGLPPDPVAVVDANGNSLSAPIQNPPVAPVLADGVFPHSAPPASLATYTTTITLPNNITCTMTSPCTLQLVEFMALHGANVGGGFYYHHCADLAITPDPALSNDAGVRDAGSGTDVRVGTGGTNGTAGASGGGTGGRGVGGGNGTAGAAGGVGGTSGGIGGAVGSAGQSGGTGVGGKGVGGNGDAGTIDVVTPPDAGCGSCAVSTRGGAAGWTAAGLLIAGLLLRRRRRS